MDESVTTHADGGADRRHRRRRRVTMADVAGAAGCSQSTVSVVLNDTPGFRISPATRERILETARRLGYEHRRPRAARGERPAQIAILFDRIASQPEIVGAIEGVRESAWATGRLVQVCETLGDREMERRSLDAIMHPETDLIVYAASEARRVTVPRRLYANHPPVVLLNCYCDDRAFPSVVPADVASAHRATERLIRAGHERIAIITGGRAGASARDRLRGYRQALADAGIPFDPALARASDGRRGGGGGYEATRLVMSLPNPPTAVFCAHGRIALACYAALRELRLVVPDDVSVIGCEVEAAARQLAPRLTALAPPHREMGRWTVDRGFASTPHRRTSYSISKLEYALLDGGSIAPPRRPNAALAAS